MDFLSTCCRQQGKCAVSLLLQQYQYGITQVLFSCVCGEEKEGEGMARQFLEWFQGLDMRKILRGKERGLKVLERKMRAVVEKVTGAEEGRRGSFAGIFCLGEECLLFSRGAYRIYLINTAFGHGHVRRLCAVSEGSGQDSGEGWSMERAFLEPDVGLLLATDSFCEKVSETMMGESLAVEEVAAQEQMDRHLRELCREGERKGGTGMGAVFVRTVFRSS